MNLLNFKKFLQVNIIFIILVALIFHVNIYMQESTIHGIRYFVDGENILHRVVWMVLVAISVSLLSYLIFDATMYIKPVVLIIM